MAMKKPSMKPETSGDNPAATDEPNITGSGMGSPPTSRGRQVANHLPHDDETTERTVQEGVDEAEEDETSQAKRTGTRSQG
jgi:hypothetical protein